MCVSSAQADTSGTAKALVASFQQLGLKFDVDEIEKVRTREAQLKMGVPGAWRRRLCGLGACACSHLSFAQRRTWRVMRITRTG
jgi:hypothetical protein